MIALLLGLLAWECRAVDSGRITARDFAGAVPEFGAVAPETPLGYAPLPGSQRNFAAAEVRRLAAQYGVSTQVSEPVCFSWAMRKLERAELSEAMGEALHGNGAKVELVEYSLFPVPVGKAVFPLDGLSQRGEGLSVWRGYVLYAGDKRFNIWAKVKAPAIFDVRVGDRVAVLVESSGAQLKLEALAVSQGFAGQTVTMRNPRSGKLFPAEVTGKGTARVEAGEGIR